MAGNAGIGVRGGALVGGGEAKLEDEQGGGAECKPCDARLLGRRRAIRWSSHKYGTARKYALKAKGTGESVKARFRSENWRNLQCPGKVSDPVCYGRSPPI